MEGTDYGRVLAGSCARPAMLSVQGGAQHEYTRLSRFLGSMQRTCIR